ncbi:ABC transporter substrate-binding protein [Nocardia implantans]|uniref:ABC transporter substrate-binding protein n=1 Tax=Nocardia implantans TaxID=3108168 RepID=A0ABU6AYW7_9NOCA|nr:MULTISPECIES: ABC transporter substrate-binding protein [unclassified Nocardia]MBF6194279.1 ABC transporter substrate-binding protein [Nocardia beijingensis]MEA3529887.1 ABC transporter substrate-binding protein [Nocardia sp. CDC192]MEB3512635.1 ABC transporter substrate-binding protein [Nocardia sp. CDC186]
MRYRKQLALVAVVVAALLTATGCRDSRTIPMAGGRPQITIMVGGLEKVIYLPAVLTRQLGFFERNDIDVTLLGEQSGATAETALLTGDVQGVVGFYDHTIDLQAKDQCIRSVVQMSDVPGEVELVSKADADITSVADLRGKKLGVTSLGSSTDFLTQALTGQAGMGTADYTRVKVGAGQTFIAGMNHDGIDAGMTTDPTVAQMVNSGDARILVDLRTEAGTRAALGGLYPATSLYMSCATIEAHPDIVRKLAAAFVQTLQWIDTHTPEEIAEKMPPQYASAGKDLYVQSIRDSIGMFNGDGLMKPEGAQNVLEILGKYSKNVRPVRDRIDLSATYTTQFVEEALRAPRQ